MISYFKKWKLVIIFVVVILITMSGLFSNVNAHEDGDEYQHENELHLEVEVRSYEIKEVILEVHDEDKGPVKSGDVSVLRESGNTLTTGKTDNNGLFFFQINSTIINETLLIEVSKDDHKETYELKVSGNVSKIILSTHEDHDELDHGIPEYQGAIAGLGYLLGLVGISGLFITWRANNKQKELIQSSKSKSS